MRINPAVCDVELDVSSIAPRVTVVESDRPGYLKLKIESAAQAWAEYQQGEEDDLYSESRRKRTTRIDFEYIRLPQPQESVSKELVAFSGKPPSPLGPPVTLNGKDIGAESVSISGTTSGTVPVEIKPISPLMRHPSQAMLDMFALIALTDRLRRVGIPV